MEIIEKTVQSPDGVHENHDEFQYINLIKDIIKKGICFECAQCSIVMIKISK